MSPTSPNCYATKPHLVDHLIGGPPVDLLPLGILKLRIGHKQQLSKIHNSSLDTTHSARLYSTGYGHFTKPKQLWTEESIGTASELWLQTGTDGELLLPIVLTRTGGSKC